MEGGREDVELSSVCRGREQSPVELPQNSLILPTPLLYQVLVSNSLCWQRCGDGLDVFPSEGQRSPLSISGNERGAEKHVLRMVFFRVPEPGAGHLAFTVRNAAENQ